MTEGGGDDLPPYSFDELVEALNPLRVKCLESITELEWVSEDQEDLHRLKLGVGFKGESQVYDDGVAVVDDNEVDSSLALIPFDRLTFRSLNIDD